MMVPSVRRNEMPAPSGGWFTKLVTVCAGAVRETRSKSSDAKAQFFNTVLLTFPEYCYWGRSCSGCNTERDNKVDNANTLWLLAVAKEFVAPFEVRTWPPELYEDIRFGDFIGRIEYLVAA